MIEKLKRDQNLHRATIVILGHEITDWLIVANILAWAIVAFGLPFWIMSFGAVISIAYGVFQAHWLIEIHDKYDTLHKPRERVVYDFMLVKNDGECKE